MSAARVNTARLIVAIGVLVTVYAAGEASAHRPDVRKDKASPKLNGSIAVVGAAKSAVTIAWKRASDDVGVIGYEVYVGSQLRGRSPTTSYTIAGLQCGRSYTISVDAFDAAGNRSRQIGVTTSTSVCPDNEAPSAPEGFWQEVTTQTAVVLRWNPSTDSVGVVGYEVFENFLLVGVTPEPSATLSGLACGRTYTYVVSALDAAGNRSAQRSVYILTSICDPPAPVPHAVDTTAPSQPDGLAVTDATQTSVSLSWLAGTDNVAVTGYGVPERDVEFCNSAAGRDRQRPVVRYRLHAWCGRGRRRRNRSGRTTVSATTAVCASSPPLGVDTTAPSQPDGLAVTDATQTSVSLSWLAGTDNVAVTGYGVYRNGTSVSATAQRDAIVSGLSCGTVYTLGVDAVDAAGNRSGRTTVSATTAVCASSPPLGVDTTAPSQPDGLAVTDATQTSVSLSWLAGTDNVAVTGYGVYRNGTSVSATAQRDAIVSGLSCGTVYTLGVDAVDAAGNRSGRTTVSATTAVCASSPPLGVDTTAPSQPDGLAVTDATQTSVSLSWLAGTDNVAVTGYGVYRNGTSVSATAQRDAIVSGLSCGTVYTLGVDAVDAAGNRSGRTTVSATTAVCASSPPLGVDTTAPSQPDGLAVTDRDADECLAVVAGRD